MSRRSLGGRGVRGVTALAVTITLASGLFATPALAAPPGVDASAPLGVSTVSFNAALVSDFDQKLAAASTISASVTSREARMADLNFVIWIYNNAPRDSAIKREALKALTNETDENACYNFIVTGIHLAFREDVRAIPIMDERHRQRLRATDLIGWMNVDRYYLDTNLSEFVTKLFINTNGTENPEIKARAAAVLTNTSTDEQRQKFVTEGIFAAYELDVQRRIEAAQRESAENKAREDMLKARADAWRVAAQAELTTSLKVMTDNDFTWEVYRSPLARKFVKAAAQSALDSHDAAVVKAFIFTGVHTAHQRDVAEEDAIRAAETEKQIKEILDLAKRDGYLPNVVAAATAALAGDLKARNEFLNLGRSEAAKRDQIKPRHELVVELQGKASGRCAQIAGVDAQAIEHGQYNELWDCIRPAPKQVWALKQVATNEYLLMNGNSRQCMDGHSDLLRQYPCDANNGYHRWSFLENSDGSYQIKNVGTGKFVTVRDSQTPNATPITTYGNTNDGHQRWRLIDLVHRSDVAAVTVGRYQLKGVQSGRCLQTAGLWETPGQGALANLAGMELWDCVGGGKMAWDLIDLGGKRYALKNVMSGKCLDVKNGVQLNGSQLIQYDCHHGDTEQFAFSSQPDGSYVLESVLASKAADAIGNAVQNGAAVGIWDVNGTSNQRWTLHVI
ncbi:RICIN domain-containing protein [Lentzea guizhouensis]|uniref:RICIN domain-containing protein n=1 Tax=Lentzea guizhouensis TaxID=1586287 RepID=UPI0012B6986A|nr:RICIN domain-containing protein [Lentzea guizhouensis]